MIETWEVLKRGLDMDQVHAGYTALEQDRGRISEDEAIERESVLVRNHELVRTTAKDLELVSEYLPQLDAVAKRLGLEARISMALGPEQSLPAIAQGVIGIECRMDDTRVRQLIAPLDHPDTRLRTLAERAMNATLAGGCQAPVAGYAELQDGRIELHGLVGWPDGSEIIRGHISGPAVDAESLGRELAEDLLARGARPILETLLGDA